MLGSLARESRPDDEGPLKKRRVGCEGVDVIGIARISRRTHGAQDEQGPRNVRSVLEGMTPLGILEPRA